MGHLPDESSFSFPLSLPLGEAKSETVDFGTELDVLHKSDDITSSSLLSFPEEAPLSLLNGGSGVTSNWSSHLKVALDDLGAATVVGEGNAGAGIAATVAASSPTRIVVTTPAVKGILSSPQKVTRVMTTPTPVPTLTTAKMITTTSTPGLKSLRILPIATYRLSTSASSVTSSGKKELITWPGNLTLFYPKQQIASRGGSFTLF